MHSGNENLNKILQALSDISDRKNSGPQEIRKTVQLAATTLMECYGEDALGRALMLERTSEEPLFAKMVTAEVRRLARGAA